MVGILTKSNISNNENICVQRSEIAAGQGQTDAHLLQSLHAYTCLGSPKNMRSLLTIDSSLTDAQIQCMQTHSYSGSPKNMRTSSPKNMRTSSALTMDRGVVDVHTQLIHTHTHTDSPKNKRRTCNRVSWLHDTDSSSQHTARICQYTDSDSGSHLVSERDSESGSNLVSERDSDSGSYLVSKPRQHVTDSVDSETIKFISSSESRRSLKNELRIRNENSTGHSERDIDDNDRQTKTQNQDNTSIRNNTRSEHLGVSMEKTKAETQIQNQDNHIIEKDVGSDLLVVAMERKLDGLNNEEKEVDVCLIKLREVIEKWKKK
jgi:hypothetical protein